MSTPETHYLNADFDPELRPRPRRIRQPALARQVRELSAQALLGAAETDHALMRASLPQEFLDYLGRCGLAVPRILPHPRIEPDARFRPFGWSAEAIELNRLHRRPVEHPPLSTIRRVNSRSFTRELEAELAGNDPRSALLGSLGELDAFVARAAPENEWIVKSEHGHAGMGNRRLRRRDLSDADRRFVAGLLAEDDRLIVEPWRTRERDWCVVFDVPFSPGALRIHETICTRDGAHIGSLFEPAGADCDPWTDALTQTAEQLATRLEAVGYFGPACFDAFTWRDGDRVELRRLADLNCRRSMSDGAWRLWRRLAPDRALYYRFFNRRKLELPEELHELVAALGEQRYDPGPRHGVILASPLRFGADDESRRPGKLALIFVGDDRSEIVALEQRFRARFES